jgi:electron transfer flavoprotein beta subunit
MRRIVVCVKAVPDPKQAEKIQIDPASKAIPRTEIPLVINPLDQNALEAALQLKEQEAAYISVVSMGPSPAGNIVKECLALGADQGVLLSDPAFAGADAYATAFTLAKAIEKLGDVDVIFCGMASSDGATEWVGPELATFLEMPVVAMVREFSENSGDTWKVKTDFENGFRIIAVNLPAVFTVTRDVNLPRKLSFSGIIKARKKEIITWGLGNLGLKEEEVGLKGSPTIVSKMETLDIQREVEWVEGTPEEKVDQLIQILTSAGVGI